MKRFSKIIMVLILAVVLISPVSYVDAAKKKKKTTTKVTTTTTTTTTTTSKEVDSKKYEKIKMYVFYGDTCPHCKELHEYLDTLEDNKAVKGKYDVVYYEVWNNDVNNNLMLKVFDVLGIDPTTKKVGVPFVVIGEDYISGFGESAKTSIIEYINNSYGNAKYKDIVKDLGTGESDGSQEETDKVDNDLVGMIILGVIAGAIILIIIFSGKSKDEDEEDEDEEVVEEPKEIKVEEPKKEVKPKNSNSSKKNNNTKNKAKKSKKN